MHASEPIIREPAVAGEFYPAGPGAVRGLVQRLLEAARSGEPVAARAAIVPHAGYAFSGPCAAQVYARIRIPDTVVILGPNHHAAGRWREACLWATGAFDSPLGRLEIDGAFAAALMAACPHVVHDPGAHALDHALEVQLPFLVVRRPSASPAIVPILVGWEDWPRCAHLAGAIVDLVRARGPHGVLLLASSDMTHFEPAAAALRHDEPALDAIRRLDGAMLLCVCRERKISMCGAAAAAIVVEASRQLGATRAEVVAHTHSGLVTGDDSSVVSYAGVVIS
ncbi:MAG: AmmeMemoRadiSam system protein B [Opitutaceae bacterium]|nr:AmmeMemoRadiSam system protein B [Opitutaceae bacterium]